MPQHVGIKSNLVACFEFFADNHATEAVNQAEFLLPDSLDEFEAIFKDGCKGGERLQQLLTRGIHMHACSVLKGKHPASTPEGARLQCLNQLYANHWLTAYTTQAALRLGDPSFRMSICFRLGLLPFFFPPDSPRLVCDQSCNVDLVKNPYHRLHCNREFKRGRYHQHNNIQAQLVSFAKSLGLSAQQTPANFRLPDDKRTPDASITLDDHVLLIDVSGIDTLAPTYLKRNASGADNAAGDRQRKKFQTYGDLEEKLDVEVAPFLYDLLGGLHPSAVQVLKDIAKAGDEEDASYRSRMRDVHRCISRMSVAIQRDNAAMLRNAFLNAKHPEIKLRPRLNLSANHM